MSGLPTAPDADVGFQPPPPVTLPIGKSPADVLPPPMAPVLGGKEQIIFNPIMIMLCGYLNQVHPGALEQAVQSAYEDIPDIMDELKIKDALSFLVFANDLLKWIPHESYRGRDIYNIITVFYYIFDRDPLHGLQTPIDPSQVGQPLTWLSSWIVVYSQLIGLHMDATSSLTTESLLSFKKSPPYRYQEVLEPKGGFKTFNQFFSRHLKPGARLIADPDDDRVIVYPADCTFDAPVDGDGNPSHSIVEVSTDGIVDIKGLKWTIESLLQGSEYAHEFRGGVWMHAFLNTFNYHRQHAPVSGVVMEAKNIQGAAYLEVNKKCEPIRHMCGPDAPDFPGYQFLQTRGMVIIDNPVLGKVAVLPIGMAQVSSVKLTVSEGDYVKKGDEISCFEFGGSDIICVFRPETKLKFEDFVHSKDNTYSFMGSKLATAPQ